MIRKMFTVLETVIQGLHFLLCNPLDIFAPGPRKWGLKWTYRRLRVTLRRWLIAILSLKFYALHKWLVL